MEILASMNNEQREAVLHTEGPLLILAGAGSGKTRVLTHRIAHLINDKKVYPSNVLAITFTNKAAKEMKDRIEHIVKVGAESIWVGTFHSICMRILRKDIEKIGYDKSFVIFDSSDQKTLVNECIKELNINEKNFPWRSMLEEIGKAKDNLMSPETYAKVYQSDFRLATVSKIFTLYQKKLKKNNALDFDDIIINAIQVLATQVDVLDYYQKKFKYIHVDEYQDTNNAQYMLISMLAGGYKNLCVVGDDDQSIYGWRGANIKNILDFEKEYPGCKVVKLEQNYRSTEHILEAANNVIVHNTGRKSKKLWTSNEKGEKLTRYYGDTEHHEAQFVVEEIGKVSRQRDLGYSNFAILYRTNAQSRVFEDSFMKAGIPYRIVGGHKYYDRKEIKDLIAYLRILANPLDNFSLKRIINVPKRGIGNTTLDNAEKIAVERNISLFSVISSANEIAELKRAASKLYDFSLLINKLRSFKSSLGLTEYVSFVLDETGLLKNLEDDSKDDNLARIENLQEFKSIAKEFEDANPELHLGELLEHISLVTDIDNVDESIENVFLMTMHSAKGLEFPVVFIVGAEEGVFPSYRSIYDEMELEEERRLCYVGITRAREKLYITHAFSRTLYGNTTCNRLCRFVSEIPEDFVDLIDGRYSGMGNKQSFSSRSGFGVNASQGQNQGANQGATTITRDSLSKVSTGSGTGVASFGSGSGSADYSGGSSNSGTSGNGLSARSFLESQPSGGSGNSGDLNKALKSSLLTSGLKTASSLISKNTSGSSNFNVGDTVTHKKFGHGTITSIEAENDDYKLEIQFSGAGMKRLMASFANLTIVN